MLDLLKRPGVRYLDLMKISGREEPLTDSAVAEQVEIQAKYEGYIRRQQEEVQRNEREESLRLPQDLDYCEVRGLSIEARQKLNQQQPATIGEASRISGVTPAAISLLLVHLKRQSMGRTAA